MADFAIALRGIAEHFQPPLGRLAESVLVTAVQVTVERGVPAQDGALEAGDGFPDALVGDVTGSEGLFESLYIAGVLRALFLYGLERVGHLNRVLDRPLGLLLETRRSAVPELCREVRRVDYRRRLPSALLAAHAARKLIRISESGIVPMAGCARDRAVGGKALLIIKPTPQRDGLSGRRVVSRHWNRRQSQRNRDGYRFANRHR